MARYLIFEKTKSFDYKFKGSSSGTNGDKAIKKLKARLSSIAISTQRIYIAIPTSQFMKYQLNPIFIYSIKIIFLLLFAKLFAKSL